MYRVYSLQTNLVYKSVNSTIQLSVIIKSVYHWVLLKKELFFILFIFNFSKNLLLLNEEYSKDIKNHKSYKSK